MQRRAFLAATSSAVFAMSGCGALNSSSAPAHWVTVYLGDRQASHEVSVTVTNDDGETVFEGEYSLSDANEAIEDAPFPASTAPESVTVIVDGIRFERDWPGFEQPPLPCDSPNSAGIEIWIEPGQDGTPGIRMEADCQHVTMD